MAEFAALHVMAAATNALIMERFAEDWPGRSQVIIPVPDIVEGHIILPDQPGLTAGEVKAVEIATGWKARRLEVVGCGPDRNY